MPAFFPASWHPWQKTTTKKLGQQSAPWLLFWLVIPSSHCLGSKHNSALILPQSHSQIGLKHLGSLSTHKQSIHLQGSACRQFFAFLNMVFKLKKSASHVPGQYLSAFPITVLSRDNHSMAALPWPLNAVCYSLLQPFWDSAKLVIHLLVCFSIHSSTSLKTRKWTCPNKVLK